MTKYNKKLEKITKFDQNYYNSGQFLQTKLL